MRLIPARAATLSSHETMAHAASGIGLQNPAFFVGRAELLEWVNGLLSLKLTKVEQVRALPLHASGHRRARFRNSPRRHPHLPARSPLSQVASGAVHCQILDACHPGVVNMSKVNFDAKSEYDMVNNYKQLQAVFDKLKISRNIEVSKLVKGRPLDNLEFLQWMKYYYDTATGGVPPTDYDGEERRANCKGAAAMKRSTGGASSARASASRTAPASRAAPSVAARRTTAATAPTTSAPTSATTNAKLAALQAENTELKLAVERTEQEREFYFEKLQDVEFLCQRAEFANNTLTKVVEKILYFTEGKPDIEAIIAECEAECRAAAPVAPEPAREPAPRTRDGRDEIGRGGGGGDHPHRRGGCRRGARARGGGTRGAVFRGDGGGGGERGAGRHRRRRRDHDGGVAPGWREIADGDARGVSHRRAGAGDGTRVCGGGSGGAA